MKIFIGNNNVASILADLKREFARLGIQSYTVVDRIDSPIINNEVDVIMPKHLKLWFRGVRPRSLQKWLIERQHIEYRVWRKAIKECDVFIFIWSTFDKEYKDLIELKKLNKKVFFIFCGDDARWYFAAQQEFDKYGLYKLNYEDSYDYSIHGLNRRLCRVRMAEKYADFIFSRLDNAQLQLRPYYRYHMWVDSKQIKNNTIQRKYKPKVVHAPSNRKVKGTEFVFEAFDKLRNEGIDFEPVLIENMSNKQALEIYSDADILIDQLIIPGTGKVSSEALAAGCVVMSHMAYDKYPQKNPSNCPIIDVNPDNIYQKLKEIILDYEKRVNLAKQGLKYVKENVDISIFCRKILDLIDGKEIDYDYYPDFFRNHFVPESEESVPIYNKWTQFVSDCVWYKKYIKSGNRDGLIF